MNGATADPRARTRRPPKGTRARMMGPSHHFLRSRRNAQSSPVMEWLDRAKVLQRRESPPGGSLSRRGHALDRPLVGIFARRHALCRLRETLEDELALAGEVLAPLVALRHDGCVDERRAPRRSREQRAHVDRHLALYARRRERRGGPAVGQRRVRLLDASGELEVAAVVAGGPGVAGIAVLADEELVALDVGGLRARDEQLEVAVGARLRRRPAREEHA